MPSSLMKWKMMTIHGLVDCRYKVFGTKELEELLTKYNITQAKEDEK